LPPLKDGGTLKKHSWPTRDGDWVNVFEGKNRAFVCCDDELAWGFKNTFSLVVVIDENDAKGIPM